MEVNINGKKYEKCMFKTIGCCCCFSSARTGRSCGTSSRRISASRLAGAFTARDISDLIAMSIIWSAAHVAQAAWALAAVAVAVNMSKHTYSGFIIIHSDLLLFLERLLQLRRHRLGCLFLRLCLLRLELCLALNFISLVDGRHDALSNQSADKRATSSQM